MKSKAVLLTTILLLLMGFVTQPAKAAGATGVTIYVVPTTTNDKILPTTLISRQFISTSISVVASPGEYEPASFVVRADGDIQSLQVEATGLAGATSSIPSANVDIRVVECWWQSGLDIKDTTQRLLTPELLLKDVSLVRVENGENYLKMANGEYRWISDPTAAPSNVYPSVEDFPVQDDATTLQPVDIMGGENKQFWVTVEVPDGAIPGIYHGVIQLRTPAGVIREIQLELEVLPIDLLAPNVVTSISYHGSVAPSWEAPTIGPYQKSEVQYRVELENLLAHGVTNPSEIGGFYLDRLTTSLSIRRELGMTGQSLYCYCGYQGTGNPTDPAELAELKNKVKSLVALAKSYGVTEVYIYGLDEAEGDLLTSQRPAWNAVHEAGGKVWTASWEVAGVFEAVGDILDLMRVGHAPDAEEAEKWHSVGHQIFSYSNPQAGQEEPETYRRNYGLLLWQSDYDGGMTFAYEGGFGNVWNDFDYAEFRDHMMVYPTVDGVVDTIQWEGFREGVDDLRYLNTLLKATEQAKADGKDTTAVETWLAALKSSDLALTNLDAVRSEIIAHILSLLPGSPSDTTPPVIAAVNHSHIGDWPMAATTITWTSDERATSQVEYGTTAQLGLFTDLDTSLVRNHEVALVGLDANGTYYFRVRSRDASGNLSFSDIRSFSTVPSAVSISFVPPTDADKAVVSRKSIEINSSIDSTYETTSFIDWNRSLVGYWDFNENSGSIGYDKSTYGSNATLRNSPQRATGKFANALNFDGVNDYVDCGNGTSLNVTNALTIEMWVKPSDLVGDQMILSKMEGARAKGYWCYLSGGCIHFAVGKGTDYQEWNAEAPLSMIKAGEWIHIVGAFASNDRIVIYVNGVEIDSKAVTGGIASTTANVYLSKYSDWYLDGLVDEVRIWNRVLSPDEIAASYNTSAHGLSHTFGDLADGTFQYYAYATDLTGRSARTETRTITVDTSSVAPADVNGDGAVNALDMIRIGQLWGQTGIGGWIHEDVNQDGIVNVLDATLVGQHWTG